MEHSRQHVVDLDSFDPKTIQDSPLRLCSYLPDRASQLHFMVLDSEESINEDLYGHLAYQGYRRSGNAFYKPNCRHCMQCISCRVPVADFVHSRRFRRVLNRNADVNTILLPASKATQEHYMLYEKYITARHADGDMYPPSLHTFEQFLVESPAHTYFMEFREPSGKLIAVAVTDKMDSGLSSVYTFFDPNPIYNKRSLGVLCVLKQMQTAKELGLEYSYLGYWIPIVKKMSYKVDYTPIELLINGDWTRFDTIPNNEDIIDLLHTFPAYFNL